MPPVKPKGFAKPKDTKKTISGILVGVYDLLAFEMDFERDVRAGQKFWVRRQTKANAFLC